jgi:hypothetical protein
MLDVDVIMPCYTANKALYEMTLNCLKSLKDSETNINFVPMILESCKTYDSAAFPYTCRWLLPNLEFNYNTFCNIGINSTRANWIVLSNNDVFYKKNWFTEILLEHIDNLPDVQSFSPWNEPFHSTRLSNKEKYYLGYRISLEITGYCLVMKRKIFNKIKQLDDTCSFYYSDYLYADQLMKYNIKHALIPASKVIHYENQTLSTLSANRQAELTTEQHKLYTGK